MPFYSFHCTVGPEVVEDGAEFAIPTHKAVGQHDLKTVSPSEEVASQEILFRIITVIPLRGVVRGEEDVMKVNQNSRIQSGKDIEIRFDDHEVFSNDERAVTFGSLASGVRRTGGIVTTDFAIVLTVINGKIARFQMLEDSFSVSRAARG